MLERSAFLLMLLMTKSLLITALFLVILPPSFARNNNKMTEAEILATADARIEKYRKAEAVIQVLDEYGNPVKNASVKITQTRHSFHFGANAFMLNTLNGEKLSLYKKRFADLLNFGTLPFYWGKYEPEKGVTRKDQVTRMARWCKVNGITTKGHPLAWYQVYPKWAPDDPDEVKALTKARIYDIVRDFKGLIDIWDVANEATRWNHNDYDNGLTKWWLRDGPANAVKECLVWARYANPEAILLYNDWNVSQETEKFIEELIKLKAPFDAIGIQSHMHRGEWTIEHAWNVCERFSRFKKPLHFTELTVLSGEHGWKKPEPWPTTPEGEKKQAEYVEKFYTVLFSHPAVEAIVWWDLQDGNWMRAPAGLVREDISPKPAYEALMKLIKGKWWTVLDLKTGRDGVCKFRGFLGDYEVIASHKGRETKAAFKLARDGNNWKIVLPEAK